MSNQATLRVHRRGNFLGMLRPFTIVLDGKEIGKLKNGAQEDFAVAPGAHSLQVKGAAWSKTQPEDIDLSPGETRGFECGVNTMFFVPVLVLAGLLIMMPRPSSDSKIAVAIYLLVVLATFVYAIVQTVFTFKPGKAYYLKETKALGMIKDQ